MIQSKLTDLKKMSSQILIKINTFIKKRLIEFFGTLLVIFSIFLLVSIVSYSPSDPNFIYTPENTEIKNVGGFYGSVVSDFLLQSIGLISIFIVFNFFYWGLKLITKKIIINFIPKIFFSLAYIVFGSTVINIYYNDSFWLIDNGNGGFVGRAIKENINYFTPLIENLYVIYSLILIAIIFFILSLGINRNEINKILFFPFLIIKKIISFFKKMKKSNNTNNQTPNIDIEPKSTQDNPNKEKQPILPFLTNKEIKIMSNNFKLPTINFLRKNQDIRNKKNINDLELTKNSELPIFFLFFKSGFFSKKLIVGNLKLLSSFLTSSFSEKGKIGCFSLVLFSL